MRRVTRWSAGAVLVLLLFGGAWVAAARPTPAAFEVRNETDHVARGSLHFSLLAGGAQVESTEWTFSIAPRGKAGFGVDLHPRATYGLTASATYLDPDGGLRPQSLGTGHASTIVRADMCRFGVLTATLSLAEDARASTTNCD